jgi:ferrochelatase
LGSQEYLTRAASSLGPGHTFIAAEPWFAHPAFVSLLASRVSDALASNGTDAARSPVIFTAHSLPERVRESGDTYPEQVAESARLVAETAGITHWEVAWQSAGRTPEPWLGPDVRDVVRRLAAEGEIDGVVVCPIGFVADHLEVLYDLDIEVAAVAASCGLTFARTASLNDDPRFIGLLADLISTIATAA